MATEVKHRLHWWLGHVLRLEQKRIPKKGLRWNPPSKRKHGRPKMTLRRKLKGRLKKDGTDMGNGRERSKRETFMEKKE